ncbi:MAG TPA: dienelactone hydrolase family protein [Steroidobacteraceae bacterium]
MAVLLGSTGEEPPSRRLPRLDCAEFETGANPRAAVVWLHGVGGDGFQSEPLIRQLSRSVDAPLRFVCPYAPFRAVTLCGGQRMRAWYDLRDADRQLRQDEAAIRESSAAVRALIDREAERGIPSENLVLGGFSQGGAMALLTGTRIPKPLAGIVALSCYPLLADTFAAERQQANQHTPIFVAHGLDDPVIDLRIGERMRDGLQASGYAVEWHSYRMGHEQGVAELSAVAAFVRRALNLTSC